MIYDIIVIGAGFSGAYAALELVKDGYNILILEKNSQVIGSESTSYNQCYKLHSGVHYFGDAITARKCLIDSIICAKQWDQFLLGNTGSLPRRNRHYIMSNSLFDVEEARKVAAMLKQTYRRLVQKDLRNRVFGDPESFIREVEPEQYGYVAQEMTFVKQGNTVIDKPHVALALDVGEPQVDIHKIQEHLQYKITHTKNITPQFSCEVVSIDPYKKGVGYRVAALKRDKTGEVKTVEFKSRGIINCAWQNIEELNKSTGVYENNLDKLLIRMKVSLLAKLPQKLNNMDTCIFSLGPYCSITNQYNGTAVLTYEPATNIGHYFQGEAPPEIVQIMQRKNNIAYLSQKIAKDIINGCAIYVPELKNAQVLEVRTGYVKMYVDQQEEYSIYNRNSPIHRRREDGIIVHDRSIAPCYISASGMKMTYAQSNAEKIRVLMKKEMEKKTSFRHAKQLDISKTQRLFEQAAAHILQKNQKFIFETASDYELANKEKVFLQPSLLKNPITLKFFVPEDKKQKNHDGGVYV